MATTTKPKSAKTKKRKYIAKPLLSNTRKPTDMPVDQWQINLRRQIAEKSVFRITNIGEGLAYSDYHVYNAGTKNTYKVALRSADNSLNYCSCYDFKTNQVGTCKHIEAVLAHISKKPGLRKALKQAYATDYTSMYVQYRGDRKIMFRIGTGNAAEYKKLLKPYLDEAGCLNGKGFEDIDLLLQKAYQINPSFRCYEDALSLPDRRYFILHYRRQKHTGG